MRATPSFGWLLALTIGALLAGLALAGSEAARSYEMHWTAAAAIAQMVSAGATIAALVAIAVAARQLRFAERDQRLRNQPYLRVDVGFPDYGEPNFITPIARPLLSLQDLKVTPAVRETLAALGADNPSDRALTVWIQNLQDAPLGIAQQVRIIAQLRWELDRQGEAGEVVIDLSLAYLAPLQTTGVVLARIGQHVSALGVQVQQVEYSDLVRQRVSGAHGAMILLYDSSKGVTNDRMVV